MVIDTSAIIAVLFDEEERDVFVDILIVEPVLVISAAAFHEASVVNARKRRDGGTAQVDGFLTEFGVEVAAFGYEDVRVAREAYLQFGKGNHPARLNLIDCCSYALAKSRNEPLLFKGSAFAKTDIAPAWLP